MTISRMHRAAIALALALLPVLPAAAQDPNESYVQSLTYAGSGCPQGTVASSFSADRKVFTLIFDQFVATLGSGVPATENRKNCLVVLRLSAPPGQTWTLLDTQYRGYVQLASGVTAQQSADYSDLATTVSATSNFNGPVAKDYLAADTVALHQDRDACGSESILLVNSQVRLLGSGQGQITTDSIDGKLTHLGGVEPAGEVTLRLAPCGPPEPVDTIPPTIAITTPAAGVIYGVGSTVAAVVTCDDTGGSGLVSCTAPATLNTATIGLKTFTATATDGAGNSTTASVTYRVGGKDDCKGGGWQLFVNGFKNQGQCVSSFVGR